MASQDPIYLTDSAAKRIAELMQEEASPGAFLRVSVDGGGCSGFTYKFAFDNESADDDVVVEKDGAKVAVDGMSLLYLIGCEIDFVESVMGSTFQVHNPNATASCGCGSSFAV